MMLFSTAKAVKSMDNPGSLTRIIGVVLLLGALGWLGACNPKDTVTFPKPPAQEPMNWLFDLEGNAADDIWACGNNGAMFHFDGDQWTNQDMGTSKPIVKMFKDVDGTIYACGHGGNIWRNTVGSWSAMDSGTSEDLYGIGSYLGNLHACGKRGVLRRLAGNSWSSTGRNEMILRDEDGAPQDTLYQNKDLAALLTVNYFAIGGAYYDPNYKGDLIGIHGTRGMVLSEDNEYDWILRPLVGDLQFTEEWVLSSTSDKETVGNNYLGTSEGWLFRLNDYGVWVLMRPKVTNDPHGGIRDIWRDAQQNLYLATDEGQLVFQTWDYNFVAGTGSRTTLMDLPMPFSAVWGTDPGNLYLVGFFQNMIIHASHNQATGDFTWEEIPVTFPDKSGGDGAFVDQYGHPLHSPGFPGR